MCCMMWRAGNVCRYVSTGKERKNVVRCPKREREGEML
jgi:hypothetical protein